jgi:hypothetical protein
MGRKETIMSTKVITGKCRASFVHIFEPKSVNGSDPKYSMSLIIPKSDTRTLRAIHAAVDEAIENGITNKWGGKRPGKLSLPLHDGDEERPDDPAFEGCWYFNCSSNNAPGVRVKDELGQIAEAMDDSDFYSGCYGCVTVNIFPYASNGNSGVGVGLNNLIKLRDGERLSGGRSAEADFSDLE